MLAAMTAGETKWLDTDQQRSWRAFIMGSTLLMDRLDRDLRTSHDLSMAEYEILVRLSEQPERRMRMAVLADAICHSRSRVTHTVTRLEKAGLITRGPAVGDGRGVEATMTDAGYALLEQAAHTHVQGVRRHLVDIVSPEDLAATGRVFDAVCDRLLPGHVDEADIRDNG